MRCLAHTLLPAVALSLVTACTSFHRSRPCLCGVECRAEVLLDARAVYGRVDVEVIENPCLSAIAADSAQYLLFVTRVGGVQPPVRTVARVQHPSSDFLLQQVSCQLIEVEEEFYIKVAPERPRAYIALPNAPSSPTLYFHLDLAGHARLVRIEDSAGKLQRNVNNHEAARLGEVDGLTGISHGIEAFWVLRHLQSPSLGDRLRMLELLSGEYTISQDASATTPWIAAMQARHAAVQAVRRDPEVRRRLDELAHSSLAWEAEAAALVIALGGEAGPAR